MKQTQDDNEKWRNFEEEVTEVAAEMSHLIFDDLVLEVCKELQVIN